MVLKQKKFFFLSEKYFFPSIFEWLKKKKKTPTNLCFRQISLFWVFFMKKKSFENRRKKIFSKKLKKILFASKSFLSDFKTILRVKKKNSSFFVLVKFPFRSLNFLEPKSHSTKCQKYHSKLPKISKNTQNDWSPKKN